MLYILNHLLHSTITPCVAMLRVGVPQSQHWPWSERDNVTGEWAGFGVDVIQELSRVGGFG